jgi:hypothetical protein
VITTSLLSSVLDKLYAQTEIIFHSCSIGDWENAFFYIDNRQRLIETLKYYESKLQPAEFEKITDLQSYKVDLNNKISQIQMTDAKILEELQKERNSMGQELSVLFKNKNSLRSYQATVK